MRLFITAGEPSGDRLGAALIDGLRTLAGEVELAGVGGPLMQGRGLASLFPMEDLSVMGIAEVLPRYRLLRRRIRQTADAALALRPDALVTIDSPDFSLRVTRSVRQRAPLHTVHYVAPTVWAWRPGRAARMARSVDQVLALFPFEPPYMEAAGMRCDFVGHPVAAEPPPDAEALAEVRRLLGGGGPVVVALPGSRRSEVLRHGPVFGATLRLVAERHADLRVLVPAVEHLRADVETQVAGWPGKPIVLAGPRLGRAAMAMADVALAKSGTVSLELAAVGTPMVIAYDMNWLSREIVRRLLRVDTVTLVNLVTGTRIVPEFLGDDCRPERIAPTLLSLIEAPGEQRRALDVTMDRLGRGGEPPGLRAARAVLDCLLRGPQPKVGA